MRCPACDKPKDPKAQECPFCGVIYARYQPRRRPEPTPASAPAPSHALRRAPYVPWKQRETLLLSLAQALEAGLSPHQFAQGPLAATLTPALAQKLQLSTQAGEALSQTLSEAGVLHPSGTALLRAAEAQGKLPGALRALARKLEAQRQARYKLTLGLLYPGLLLISAILVQNLGTLVLVGPAAYAQAVLGPLLGIGLVAVFLFYGLPRLDPRGRVSSALKPMFALMPPLGRILWHSAIADFASALGDCITAGLSVREALSLAAEASGHRGMIQRSPQALAALDQGAQLAEALAALGALNAEDRALIGHGELVGKLDEVLPKIAAHHHARAKTLTTIAIVVTITLSVAIVFGGMIHQITSGWSRYFNSLGGQLDSLLK